MRHKFTKVKLICNGLIGEKMTFLLFCLLSGTICGEGNGSAFMASDSKLQLKRAADKEDEGYQSSDSLEEVFVDVDKKAVDQGRDVKKGIQGDKGFGVDQAVDMDKTSLVGVEADKDGYTWWGGYGSLDAWDAYEGFNKLCPDDQEIGQEDYESGQEDEDLFRQAGSQCPYVEAEGDKGFGVDQAVDTDKMSLVGVEADKDDYIWWGEYGSLDTWDAYEGFDKLWVDDQEIDQGNGELGQADEDEDLFRQAGSQRPFYQLYYVDDDPE